MKKVCFIVPFIMLSASFLFFSCATSFHLPVPGESRVIRSSIYSEYMTIADAYSELKKYDKASQYYELAKKNKNLYWTATYSQARCNVLNGKYDEALLAYEELLARDGENLSLMMSMAYLYAVTGDIPKAEKTYSELWEKNPDNPDVLVNYISVLFASKNIAEAESKVAELKEKFPGNKSVSDFEAKLKELEKKSEQKENGSVSGEKPAPEKNGGKI